MVNQNAKRYACRHLVIMYTGVGFICLIHALTQCGTKKFPRKRETFHDEFFLMLLRRARKNRMHFLPSLT